MSTLTSTRRLNPLTGDYVLVSPIRLSRPWSQQLETVEEEHLPKHDPQCYLCPKNVRANGSVNPDYHGVYTFPNDYAAFVAALTDNDFPTNQELFQEQEETGICEVMCYAPDHDLNFVNLPLSAVAEVVKAWKKSYAELSLDPQIGHIQIFETRGKEVGNSAPHPHCQIWSQRSIPSLPRRIYEHQRQYFDRHHSKLLVDYVTAELKQPDRVIFTQGDFVLVVPFWAEWPYETYIVPRVSLDSLTELSEAQVNDLARLLIVTAKMYAQFFGRPQNGAPYTMSISQQPTTKATYPGQQLFFRFISPLLIASRQKYQAGYEKSAEPQRDLTPEQAATELRVVAQQLTMNVIKN